VKDDGLRVIGVAGLLPSRQVPGNQGSEFFFGNGFRGIRGKWLRHGSKGVERKPVPFILEPRGERVKAADLLREFAARSAGDVVD
jgi:hypothetical protein